MMSVPRDGMDETSRIMNEVNMKKIAEDADTISRKMGFAGIDKFSVMRRCQCMLTRRIIRSGIF